MKQRWDKFVAKVNELNNRSNGWLLFGLLLVGIVVVFRQGRRAF